MLLLLARILGGAVDQRESVAAYLADPAVVRGRAGAWPASVLLADASRAGCRCWRGGFLLILPAANPKFQTLLTSAT